MKTLIKLLVAYLVIGLISFEAASRLFWKTKGPELASNAREFIYHFYTDYHKLRDENPTRQDGVFDILILSGSAMHHDWGNVPAELLSSLQVKTNRPFKIHNQSFPTHTSLDSWIKYRRAEDQQFDLVVFYHGINEVRANNAPPEMYRKDYSHYAWYDKILNIERLKDVNWTRIPHTFYYARTYLSEKIAKKTGKHRYVPGHRPIPEWLKYGSEIKTRESFAHHLEQILILARKRKEKVLLMTYATYLPEGYTAEKFKNKTAGYSGYRVPTELWGHPANVLKGVQIHNRELEKLAARYKTGFINQAARIPQDGLYFDDICHLSKEGSRVFAENLAIYIAGQINSSQ